MRVKGIGRWPADIYRLMALGRPDVSPVGDLTVATALMRAKELPGWPTAEDFERFGNAWKPWPPVAARLIWHDDLTRDRRSRDRD